VLIDERCYPKIPCRCNPTKMQMVEHTKGRSLDIPLSFSAQLVGWCGAFGAPAIVCLGCLGSDPNNIPYRPLHDIKDIMTARAPFSSPRSARVTMSPSVRRPGAHHQGGRRTLSREFRPQPRHDLFHFGVANLVLE